LGVDQKHESIPLLKRDLAEGRIDRREFLRLATLLGLSASTAYALVGEPFVAQARAALPQGGILRLGSRIKEIKNPATYSWGWMDSNISRQVVEYLTFTDEHNVTRPSLCEKWEVSPDLKTWTLHLRRDVKWHKGRPFTAEDVVWNLKRVLDPEVGSSVIGLMKGYMLTEFDTGQKDDKGNPKPSTRLWDANAIEKVDDHTVRLNCKEPQVAVPEHLFHYPLAILDPEEKGVFGAGSNGTGAFDLVDFAIGKNAVLKSRKDYWGEKPNLEQLEFLDVGDDPSAAIAAMASKQIHGLVKADPVQFDALKALPGVDLYQVETAETAVMRVKVTQKPFDNPKVRKAMRLAVDPPSILQVALRGLGVVGEHTHVAPSMPEYAKIPVMKRDVAAAKKLLAEAGYPNGFDAEITVAKDETWHAAQVEAAAEQWKDAGIRVTIKLLSGAQFWEVWDKVPFGCTLWGDRPLAIMLLGLAYRTGVPWNESSYANPEFDKLLTQAEGMIDVTKRREVILQLERIMQEDGPLVQPVWRNNFTFMDKRVKGFTMHPSRYIFGNKLAIESA
jgi:peptide/nickel transport system substrate-binding protein